MGWLFAGMFVLVALCNFSVLLGWYAHGKSGSLIPLIGGLSGIVACVTLPFPALTHWWWTPLIVDLGSAFLISGTLLFFIRRACKDTGR